MLTHVVMGVTMMAGIDRLIPAISVADQCEPTTSMKGEQTMTRKPSARAMLLNYHYRVTFIHSLQAIKNHPEYGGWWKEMDNFDRAYVLKGERRSK